MAGGFLQVRRITFMGQKRMHRSENAGLPGPLMFWGVVYGGMVVLAGFLAAKQVTLGFGGLAVEAGIFAFLLLVIISSTIAQLYGEKTANRLVFTGFVPLAISVLLVLLVRALPASPDMPPANLDAFQLIHASNWRIMLAGPAAYGVSMLLNVWIFNRLRGSGDGEGLWLALRGGIASALSQAVDSVIFITLAFYGEFPIGPLIVGQALAKIVLSFVLVPVLLTVFVAASRHFLGRDDPRVHSD